MEISIVPIGTGTASVSKDVVEALKVLKNQKNIKYRLTAMGTIIEADCVDILLSVAKKMHEAVLKKEVRVLTIIRIDERKDKKLTIDTKLQSVKRKLEKKAK